MVKSKQDHDFESEIRLVAPLWNWMTGKPEVFFLDFEANLTLKNEKKKTLGFLKTHWNHD